MPCSLPRWPAYLRIPAFVPVPLRSRRDGWTPARQGEFIGWLAETGSVSEAAARVGCARESAYRLRRRDGGEGFAAAWDFALSCGRHIAASWKVTPSGLAAAALGGLVRVRMRRGRYAGCVIGSSDSALLGLLAWLDRTCGRLSGQGWP